MTAAGPRTPRHLLCIAHQAIHRCTNRQHVSFKNYGARGITVWPAWIESPPAFRDYIAGLPGSADMRLTIDRIDNDRGYEPGNLRWATRAEQAQNRRPRKAYESPTRRARSAAHAQIGSRIGSRTVLDLQQAPATEENKRAHRRAFAIARCDCGAESRVAVSDLARGGCRQCRACQAAASREVSLSKTRVGSRFGSWLVTGHEVNNAKTCALVRCNCGRERSVPVANLTNGVSRQCRSCASRKPAPVGAE